MSKGEKLWRHRIKALKEEHKCWARARDRRLKEYKFLWQSLENKRRQLHELWFIHSNLTKNLYRIRIAMGLDEKLVRRLAKKELVLDPRTKGGKKYKKYIIARNATAPTA